MTPHFLSAAKIFGLGRVKQDETFSENAGIGDFVDERSQNLGLNRLVEGAYDVGGPMMGLGSRSYGGI